MNNPQDTVFAATTPEAPPAPAAPIQGRPVGVSDGAAREELPAPTARPKPKRRSVIWIFLGLVAGSRWILAIPAILLAVYGGKLIEDARVGPIRPNDPPLLAWQLLGLAGLLLAVAALPGKPSPIAGPSALIKNLRAMKWRWLFLLLLFGSLACAIVSVPLFTQLNTYVAAQFDPASNNLAANDWWANTGSWLLFVTSLVLFGLAWAVWERKAPIVNEGVEVSHPSDRLPRGLEWVIMIGLFAVATFLRLWNLETLPPGFWYDEAQNGLVGVQFMQPNGAHFPFVGGFTQLGGLYFYFLGSLINLFGNTIFMVRLLPAMGGALAVPLLYMLASRIYGWRVGLAAAGLVMVGVWHITFSRFALVSIITVTIDVAVYLCVVQGLRTGRLGYFAAGGVLLGLGLHMYYPARIAVIVLLAVLAHRLITERIRLVRAVRTGLIVFALGVVLATIPISLFALQHYDLYTARTSEIWIFGRGGEGNPLAFNMSLHKHLLMFNWLGDGNGRHNLPGQPMFDWITSTFFFAGLAACALRFWRWQYFFPVIWWIGSMSGGVLSLLFEAPQGNRTVENSLVGPLIAGIFIGEAWQALAGGAMVERLTRVGRFAGSQVGRFRHAVAQPSNLPTFKPSNPLRWPTRISWAVSAAALLLVVYLAGTINYNRYFVVQANDMSVWQDMYTPQAQTARMIQKYHDTHDIYVTAIYRGLPPSEFLAPNIPTQVWPGMQAIPLSIGANKPGGIVILLDEPSAADVATIARIYPHARFEITTAPGRAEVLLYTIIVPKSDIDDLHGVHVSLYEDGSTKAKLDKNAQEFSYNWDQSSTRSGTLRMSATLKVDTFGTYRFDWKSAQGSEGPRQLLVDGYDVSASKPITLGFGLHSIVATDTVKSGAGVSQLLWGSAGSGSGPIPASNLFDPRRMEPHGLTALLRAGGTFETTPVSGRIDPVISFYLQETMLPRPYTVEWNGRLYIPEAGTYVFATEQLSSSRLFLDGKEILNNPNINAVMETPQTLTQGWHEVRLLFADLSNFSHMYLYWNPPGRPRTKIPAAFLWPQMGQYPDKPESGDFPTLEESDGTQLPVDRVTYWPPRTQQQATEKPQQAPPVGVVAPPPAQPESTPVKGKVLQPLFVLGESGGTLGKPKAAAADSSGNIYIFTEQDSKIHKYDPNGSALASWDVKDGSSKPLTEGSALTVKGDHIYLLDSQGSDLIGFTLDGKPGGAVHLCACFFPRDASVSRDGNFWVANTGNGQVLKISATGEAVKSTGTNGTEPGMFVEPASVWEAKDGTLYVADVGNKRVQSFTSAMAPLAQWPMGQSIARDGNRLTGDDAGNVLVTQYDDRAIVLYDKSGKELDRWAFRRNGTTLIPAEIASLGDNKFLVIYPNEGLAAVFSK